ncbi:hypothetical protein EfmAA96_14590 [Enterococcus faecium]|nr:hypothetical protein EfmAA96_14590 [Enterococcus faecium]
MLDENTSLGLTAPTAEHPNTIWFNIIVSDIEDTHNKALRNGLVVVFQAHWDKINLIQ